MSNRPRSPRQKSVTIPVHGNLEHNAGIYLSIGSLVVNWANNESVFLAMLHTVVGGEGGASQVIWYSQRTTRARLDLLLRLCSARVKDTALLTDIRKAASQFKGFTRVRNLYCHGLYGYDDQLRLIGFLGMSVADDGEPVRAERKMFNRGTLNEIADTITKLATLNRHLWELVQRLASALGVPPVPIPRLPSAELGADGEHA